MATLCKNCGHALVFKPTSQKLVCGACGGAFAPEEIARINGNTVDVDIGQLREKRFAMRNTPYEQQGSLDDLHGVFGKIDEE